MFGRVCIKEQELIKQQNNNMEKTAKSETKIVKLTDTTAASVVKDKYIYTPLGNSILLKVPDETSGGIILPETMQGEFISDEDACVVGVGPDVKHVKVGDYIKLYSHAAKSMMRVDVNKKLYVQFSETLVAGILKPNEA